MNILPLLTFYFINSQSQFADHDINREIAKSLLYVVEGFFMERSSSFTFILSCEREHTMNFYKDLVEVFFGYGANINTQIVINHGISVDTFLGSGIYNLLLVDSSESFLNLDPASRVKNFDINEYYYVFLQNRDRFLPRDIRRILEYCWKNYIINVNIQVQKATGDIIVYSYFPFTESHCGKVVPVEVNRYINGTMAKADLFPQKLLNMFNCPVRVATWDVGPYLTLDFSKSGREMIGGFEGRLLRQLSKLINFRIDVIVPPNNEDRGMIFGNHSTGAIGLLRRRDADLSLGCFWFSKTRSKLLTASDSYHQASNVAILMANSIYLTDTTLWFPFKGETAIALLAAFLITLGLALVILKRFVYPPTAKHRDICLNFISCTLGYPSSNVGRRNSARIFIMGWILFTLIIRTEYSAIIYHLIRHNLFRKPPSTFRDIVELNYTFALTNLAYNSLRQVTVKNENEGGVFMYLESHSNERLFTIAPLDLLLYYVAKNKKSGVLTILKESFMVQHSCIYFTKHSFMVDRVNYLVQRINAVGLLDGWVKKAIDLSYLKSQRRQLEVTIGHKELIGIFNFCGIMLAGSLLVFCLEIMSLRIEFLSNVFEKL